MLARNRFLLLVAVGGAALAIISLSLQFCKCAVMFVIHLTASHIHSVSDALAQYSNFNVKDSAVFNSSCVCMCVCVHTCISFHCVPIQQTPFIPRQSTIPYRVPINIQLQQRASGYSETLGETVATHISCGMPRCIYDCVFVQHLL